MRKINEIKQKFLINSEDTGRFLVKSLKSGKTYFVEAIGDPHLEWGSLDPATKDLTNKKGWKKYKGSITDIYSTNRIGLHEENETLITKENGFVKLPIALLSE